MQKAEEVKSFTEKIREVVEKIDICRYKMGVIQDRFDIPPNCDGWHEPKDPVLFALGVKTILDEALEGITDARDSLCDLEVKS